MADSGMGRTSGDISTPTLAPGSRVPHACHVRVPRPRSQLTHSRRAIKGQINKSIVTLVEL
eukprot:4401123-Prymnesium_polylepis.1